MCLSHFNLTQHPFMENPPIEWILTDPRIEQALARLKFFQDQGLMALILGQTGIGKSTLLRLFIHFYAQSAQNLTRLQIKKRIWLDAFGAKLTSTPSIWSCR